MNPDGGCEQLTADWCAQGCHYLLSFPVARGISTRPTLGFETAVGGSIHNQRFSSSQNYALDVNFQFLYASHRTGRHEQFGIPRAYARSGISGWASVLFWRLGETGFSNSSFSAA